MKNNPLLFVAITLVFMCEANAGDPFHSIAKAVYYLVPAVVLVVIPLLYWGMAVIEKRTTYLPLVLMVGAAGVLCLFSADGKLAGGILIAFVVWVGHERLKTNASKQPSVSESDDKGKIESQAPPSVAQTTIEAQEIPSNGEKPLVSESDDKGIIESQAPPSVAQTTIEAQEIPSNGEIGTWAELIDVDALTCQLNRLGWEVEYDGYKRRIFPVGENCVAMGAPIAYTKYDFKKEAEKIINAQKHQRKIQNAHNKKTLLLKEQYQKELERLSEQTLPPPELKRKMLALRKKYAPLFSSDSVRNPLHTKANR